MQVGSGWNRHRITEYKVVMLRLVILSLALIVNLLPAQIVVPGHTLPDLSGTLCANGEGSFNFQDYNVDVNPAVILLTVFASW